MVTKSLLYKYAYQNILSRDSLPKIEIDNISQLLIDINRIWPSINYKVTNFPVNFRNVMEGTRKDIIFSYKDKESILGEPIFRNGEMIPTLKGMKDTERIIKVDIVSFFTKIKDNSSEFRIYQLGRRYKGEDINFK